MLVSRDRVHDMLKRQTEVAVAVALKRIADEACEKLRNEIMGQADALALQLLREYDVIANADRVIISVKKTT